MTDKPKAKRRGWGHSRFEIHAFVGDYRIDMNWPKADDMEQYSLDALVIQLERCLNKLKAVAAEAVQS